MLPVTNTFDINERLFLAIETGSYENALKCLMEGAQATKISASCGRTAVGQAALLGEAEILELLLQSCEEPEMDIFRKTNCSLNMSELEIDITPDDMDKLEWDDEFDSECEYNSRAGDSDDCISLYFYYAKTFERTGHILTHMEESGEGGGNTRSRQDPHTVDALSMAPLHYAAACGHVECLRTLLDHGAQVDVATADGVTPLHAATQSEEVVRLLLSYKANPNRKTFSTGESPLHVAIRHRNTAVINQFLSSTVNINEPDSLEQTPLMLAIAHHLDDVAIRLIDMGAKLNLEDSCENTALYLAVTQNNVTVAAYLLAKGARLIISHFLLHHAVKHNYLRMAELLIEHGENLNVRDMFGNSAILLAIMFKNVEMLECLLKAAAVQRQQGKHIDHTEMGLLTAVQYTSSACQFKAITRLLLAYDEVNLNRTDSGEMTTSATCGIPYCGTPLSRAILLYKMDIAEVLIKEGADMSQICREHVVNTLRLGLQKGFVTLAILLVHAGLKFPALPLGSPFKDNWRPYRIQLEATMRQLNCTPLSLQSLARIQIRQHLINILDTSAIDLKATKQQSALGRAVSLLGIPKPLQKFLIDFDDLPSVALNNCD